MLHVARRQLQHPHQLLGDIPRLAAELLREHQREIGSGIAMRRVARRFDRELETFGRTQGPRRTCERVAQQLERLHLSPESFFLALSEALGWAGLDSAGFDSPSFLSCFSSCFSPARL